MSVMQAGVAVSRIHPDPPAGLPPGDPTTVGLFERLWRAYYRRLWVFVRAFGALGAEEAEDEVQEIMWKIFSALPRLDRARPSAPWVFRIARNHCIDRMRSHGGPCGRTRAPAAGEAAEVPDTTPGPLESLVRAQECDEVDRFLEALPPTDRQILYLAYFERFRLRDVAAALRMPVGTVKYRVHELKRRYREGGKERP